MCGPEKNSTHRLRWNVGKLQILNPFNILITGQLTSVYSLIFLSIYLEPTKDFYVSLGRVLHPVLPMLS
jgi:hypothetical protein